MRLQVQKRKIGVGCDEYRFTYRWEFHLSGARARETGVEGWSCWWREPFELHKLGFLRAAKLRQFVANNILPYVCEPKQRIDLPVTRQPHKICLGFLPREVKHFQIFNSWARTAPLRCSGFFVTRRPVLFEFPEAYYHIATSKLRITPSPLALHLKTCTQPQHPTFSSAFQGFYLFFGALHPQTSPVSNWTYILDTRSCFHGYRLGQAHGHDFLALL